MSAGLVRAVAASAGISSASARRVAASAAHRYKIYTIKKKGGGLRTVAQPAREVKALQRALVYELEKKLPVHVAATAYKRGSSIINNAAAHRDARYLLKLDFEAFFPSIGERALLLHLKKHAEGVFSESELRFILDLVLWLGDGGKRSLCIGAPSSPFLSNSVMYAFDEKVSDASISMNVSYTRYSDDITLSCAEPGVLGLLEQSICEMVKCLVYPELKFNEKKRKAVSRAAGMYVTGLTLSNQGDVTVGRSRKRGVRAGVKRFLEGVLDDKEVERLKGELAFVLSVEAGFRQVLLKTYGMRVFALM